MRVDVYKNTHRDTFSIRSREKDSYGKVIGHTNSIFLRNVRFVVSQAGKNRVRREKKKNVHAVLRAETFFPRWSEKFYCLTLDNPVVSTYNPYCNDTFVVKSTSLPIIFAPMVRIKNGILLVYSPNTVYKKID